MYNLDDEAIDADISTSTRKFTENISDGRDQFTLARIPKGCGCQLHRV